MNIIRLDGGEIPFCVGPGKSTTRIGKSHGTEVVIANRLDVEKRGVWSCWVTKSTVAKDELE